jgi:hypothetical protein
MSTKVAALPPGPTPAAAPPPNLPRRPGPADAADSSAGGGVGAAGGSGASFTAPARAQQELMVEVPVIGAKLDSRQFEILMDVIQNIFMAPMPQVRKGDLGGCGGDLVSMLTCVSTKTPTDSNHQHLIHPQPHHSTTQTRSPPPSAGCGWPPTAPRRRTTTGTSSLPWRRSSRCGSASARCSTRSSRCELRCRTGCRRSSR